MIDKNDPRLTAYVLDELDAVERAEVQAAIDASPELQSVVEQIRETTAAVGSLFDSRVTSGRNKFVLAEAQRTELEQEIAAVSSDADQKQASAVELKTNDQPFYRRTGFLASIAALLLIGLTVAMWWPSFGGEDRVASQDSNVEVESDLADLDLLELTRKYDEKGISQEERDRIEEHLNRLSARKLEYDFGDEEPVDSLVVPHRADTDELDIEEATSSGDDAESGFDVDLGGGINLIEALDSTRYSENLNGVFEANNRRHQGGAQPDQQSGDQSGEQGGEPRSGQAVGGLTGEMGFSSQQSGDSQGQSGSDNFGAIVGGAVVNGAIDHRFAGERDHFLRPGEANETGKNDETVGSSVVDGSSSTRLASDGERLGALINLDDIPAEPALGFEMRSRMEPVQRWRTESRTRDEAGTNEETEPQTVQGDFAVEVPDTESVHETYRAIVLPSSETNELIPQLLKRVDPSGSREIMIRSLGEDQIEFKYKDSRGWAEVEGETMDGRRLSGEELGLAVVEEATERVGKLLADNGVEGEVTKEEVVDLLQREIGKRNALIRKQKTWRRSQASPNASRLMVGDHGELDLNGMQVHVQVEGFRARVLIDCFYYNDRAQELEGNFKLRLPDDASLYYFAFGQSVIDYSDLQRQLDGEANGENDDGQDFGRRIADEFLSFGRQFVSLGPETISQQRQDTWENVKESRMVQKEKAAHAYSQTVRRRVDPALVEWTGAGVFIARVFPLMPQKQHRIVIGYDVDLKRTADGWTYELDLPNELLESAGKCRVNMDVLQVPGATMSVLPNVKPDELEEDEAGNGHWHYSFDTFATGEPEEEKEVVIADNPNFVPNSERRFVQLNVTDTGPVVLRSSDASQGGFFATRITPDLPEVVADSNSHALFLLDTSLSSQPDKFNVWLNMMRTTLDSNRDSLKHFGVLMFNVENHFWKEEYVANTPDNVEDLIEYCEQLALEGATDLYGSIDAVGKADWASGDKVRPDLFLLSDGAANWGETSLRLMLAQFEQFELGSLFAYQSGLDGTAIANLRFLAGETGGAVFSIVSEAEIETAAKAHRNRPWLLESIEVDGGEDLMTAGRVKWVYPGQSLMVVGRVADGDATTLGGVRLNLTQGSKEKAIDIGFENELKSSLASRLYGQVAVGQLESLGETVVDVATAYARHFRITGATCSLLMLESEADYQRFDIKPEEDLFVIKSKAAGKLIAKTLDVDSEKLSDPKAQLMAWINRLESMPGIEFETPTALKLALDEIEVVAISESLNCDPVSKDDLSEAYAKMLLNDRLDYSQIRREAISRSWPDAKPSGADLTGNLEEISIAGGDAAMKVMSNLIERNPGDLVVTRDVAFTAMELHQPAQAYHLLRRVVVARPFDPSVYTALGQCLAQLNQHDMALVYYEIAVSAQFPNRGDDYRRIAATEYVHLLNRIVSDDADSTIKDYATARLESLTEKLGIAPADVVVTMMWNTDQTDVDLHIIEPSGEECFYQHKDTRSGGKLTRDITDGFGPEMYTLPQAPEGEYRLLVNYFANNQNRTDMRSKVYLTIYREFGTPDATVRRKTIELNKVGGKIQVDTLSVK